MLQNNIPEELRALPQWCACNIDPASPNTKRPINPKNGFWADVANPSTWGTFEQAMKHGPFVGFVLSPNDPYTIIDLDNKPDDPVSDETLAWYNRLAEMSDTYVERSASGRGLHIIMRAALPNGQGRKRASSEIYSQERFMICTGDVVIAKPITEQQELATWFWQQLAPPVDEQKDKDSIPDEAQTLTDDAVMEMAWSAENGPKFQALWWGKWEELGYSSQSEADLSLMSMLGFYSYNNAQCLRLFRMSELGKREKAVKDDKYLLRETLAQVRARQPRPPSIPDLDSLRAQFEQTKEDSTSVSPHTQGPGPSSIPFSFQADPSVVIPDQTLAPKLPQTVAGGHQMPPGLIGEVAQYIFSSAQRPVAEIALAAALGMVAGIAGRAFNISQVGLNQYIVLIAKTGTGKEAAGQGIDRLFNACRKYAPQSSDFQGPAAFASGQSLARILPEKPCFVSVLGEFGLLLQGMSKSKPGDPMHTLKRALLDIYNKSGCTSWLKPTVYSDKEKNTQLVQAPNVTFVGESTPEEFYKALDESAVMDGFVPRLMLIEYKGDRPARNTQAGFAPSEDLVKRLADLINVAIGAAANPEGVQAKTVTQSPEAYELLSQFDHEIDTLFRGLPDGPSRQILNRAHLKAVKLAGLLAVGVNHYNPVVTPDLAAWAIEFVRKEMTTMMERFDSGEVGEGEDGLRGIEVIKGAIKRALFSSKDEMRTLRNSYRFPPKLEGTSIIPYTFLVRYCKNRQPFKSDRRGSTRALQETIGEMVATGMLVKLTAVQASGSYGLHGDAYTIGSAF